MSTIEETAELRSHVMEELWVGTQHDTIVEWLVTVHGMNREEAEREIAIAKRIDELNR